MKFAGKCLSSIQTQARGDLGLPVGTQTQIKLSVVGDMEGVEKLILSMVPPGAVRAGAAMPGAMEGRRTSNSGTKHRFGRGESDFWDWLTRSKSQVV